MRLARRTGSSHLTSDPMKEHALATEMPQPGDPVFDGKYPLIGLKIVKDFDRPPAELVEAFGKFFLPDVSDWVGVLYTMDHTVRPAYSPMRKILGPAFTVKVPPGDNLMVKKALHMAQPGDVIVVDSRGHTDWCLGGGGMTVMAKKRGIAGMVLDGAYRDIEQIQNIDFPMFLRGIHPSTGPKRGPGEINVPISCGGVIVQPGDIVYGDREGVVVVPQAYAQMIVDKVSKVPIKKESDDWDWDNIVEDDKERVEYFDAVLAARGVEIIERAQ